MDDTSNSCNVNSFALFSIGHRVYEMKQFGQDKNYIIIIIKNRIVYKEL